MLDDAAVALTLHGDGLQAYSIGMQNYSFVIQNLAVLYLSTLS